MKKSIGRFCFQSIGILVCICIFCFSSCKLYANSEDSASTQSTLSARDANGNEIGSLTGTVTDGSKLVMENDPSKLGYAEISRSYLPSASEVFTYGVQIMDGHCDGAADLVFMIGNQYDGMTAKIITERKETQDASPSTFDEKDAIVIDGRVQVSVSYDFTIQTPFVIGVYPSEKVTEQTEEQPKPKPDLVQKTLTDKRVPSVQITGRFSEDAVISVTSVDKKENRCKKLLENSNTTFLAGYEIKLTTGRYEGKVNVSISLGITYANKKVQVSQLLKDDKLLTEEKTGTSVGDVIFEADNLSPIIITERKPISMKEASTVSSSTILYIGGGAILIFAGIAGIIYKKKK